MEVSFKMLHLVLTRRQRSFLAAYINDFDFALKNMSNGYVYQHIVRNLIGMFYYFKCFLLIAYKHRAIENVL